MKFRVLLIIVTLLGGLFAVASDFLYEGHFVDQHPIYSISYLTKAACEADQGKWDGESEDDGFCVFEVEDDAVIARNESGELQLTVSMVGSNYHTCDFESVVGTVVQTDTLLFSAPSEEWDSETGEFLKKTCEITVKYLNSDEVSLSNNGSCTSSCGANMSLEIEKAVRK